MLWVQFLILLILIGMNAFFASSEVALISLKHSSIRKLIQRGGLRGKALAALTGNTGRFLATVQVGVTLAGFLASAFAADSFSDPLTGWLERCGFHVFSHGVLDLIVVVVITVILSYVSLVFGELVPKQIGIRYSEWIAFNVALPIHFLANAAKPFVFILNASVDLCMKAFGTAGEQEQNVTEEEIRTLVDIGGEQGVISPEKKEMLENVFEFSSREASGIMTHRTEIAAINLNASPEEIERIFVRARYSRFPVYRGDLDDIAGIVHIRDYFTEKFRRGGSPPELTSIMKPAWLVPETIRADRLFTEMKREKTGMAVLLDEFGGTAGIITNADLVSEIVGSFADADGEEHETLESLGENIWRVDASIRLDQLKRMSGISLPEDSRYDTLGGLILTRIGGVPGTGSVIDLSESGISLQVESVKGQHLGKIVLRRGASSKK